MTNDEIRMTMEDLLRGSMVKTGGSPEGTRRRPRLRTGGSLQGHYEACSPERRLPPLVPYTASSELRNEARGNDGEEWPQKGAKSGTV